MLDQRWWSPRVPAFGPKPCTHEKTIREFTNSYPDSDHPEIDYPFLTVKSSISKHMSTNFHLIRVDFFRSKNRMHRWLVLRQHSAKKPQSYSRIIHLITPRRIGVFAFIQRNWWSKPGSGATTFTGDEFDTCSKVNGSDKLTLSKWIFNPLCSCLKKTESRSSPHHITADSRSPLAALINGKRIFVQTGYLLSSDASPLGASLLIWIFRRVMWNFIRPLFAICRTEFTPPISFPPDDVQR
jgi:hypothetical protein